MELGRINGFLRIYRRFLKTFYPIAVRRCLLKNLINFATQERSLKVQFVVPIYPENAIVKITISEIIILNRIPFHKEHTWFVCFLSPAFTANTRPRATPIKYALRAASVHMVKSDKSQFFGLVNSHQKN